MLNPSLADLIHLHEQGTDLDDVALRLFGIREQVGSTSMSRERIWRMLLRLFKIRQLV
jgi:hypothetical protein